VGQYLLIPFLGGWTSINPSYFDVNYRGTRFWHTAILGEWSFWGGAGQPQKKKDVFSTIVKGHFEELWIWNVHDCSDMFLINVLMRRYYTCWYATIGMEWWTSIYQRIVLVGNLGYQGSDLTYLSFRLVAGLLLLVFHPKKWMGEWTWNGLTNRYWNITYETRLDILVWWFQIKWLLFNQCLLGIVMGRWW